MSLVSKVLGALLYIQVLAALAMIGLSIYLLVQDLIIAQVSAILLLCLGIALFILSCFGVVGSHRKSGFCLCLFQVGIIPLTLAALALAIGATVYSNDVFADGRNQYYPELSKNCEFDPANTNAVDCQISGGDKYQSILPQLYESTQYAASWWGRDNSTQGLGACKINGANLDQSSLPLINSWGLTFVNYQSFGSPNSAEGCPQYKNDTAPSNFVAYATFMQYLEKTYSCSGIGVTYPYHIFYNFQENGSLLAVEGSCTPHVQETLQNWFKITYITCYVVFSFLLVNSILSMMRCCQRKHHHHHEDIYQRMNYYDD